LVYGRYPRQRSTKLVVAASERLARMAGDRDPVDRVPISVKMRERCVKEVHRDRRIDAYRALHDSMRCRATATAVRPREVFLYCVDVRVGLALFKIKVICNGRC